MHWLNLAVYPVWFEGNWRAATRPFAADATTYRRANRDAQSNQTSYFGSWFTPLSPPSPTSAPFVHVDESSDPTPHTFDSRWQFHSN